MYIHLLLHLWLQTHIIQIYKRVMLHLASADENVRSGKQFRLELVQRRGRQPECSTLVLIFLHKNNYSFPIYLDFFVVQIRKMGEKMRFIDTERRKK